MTTLVTGANGQLGQALVSALRAAAMDVTALDRSQLDVADRRQVTGVVTDLRPEIVINTAALTDVDGCERDPFATHAVNAMGPWWLAQACAATNARLITVSTDYVFDGALGHRPYTEEDPSSPINVYGRTKALGEALVRATLDDHQIVRTAWLAGATDGAFVAAIMRAAADQPVLHVVDDQHGSPTFAHDLAAAILARMQGPTGTWHLTNQGVCSRYEFACAIVAACGLDTEVVPRSTIDGQRPARRPGKVELADTRSAIHGFDPLPDWRAGLARLLETFGHCAAGTASIDVDAEHSRSVRPS